MIARSISARLASEIINGRHPEWRLTPEGLISAGKAKPKRVPCTVKAGRYYFNPDEIEAVCASRICPYEECGRVGLGKSGACARHGHVFIGGRAEGVKRPDIGPKIARKKRGSKHTAEARAKMAEKKRIYKPEKRFDQLTGEQIIPRRPGLEDVPLERLAELGLDLIPGHVIRRGHGKFVNQSNKARHQIEHDPSFGFPSLGRRHDVTCWLCRGIVERYQSQIAAADAEKRRFVCPACDGIWRPALQRARRAVDELEPRAPFPTTSTPALMQLLDIAREFERSMRRSVPARRGQPRHYGDELAIEALHLRGFADDSIDRILGPRGADWSRSRRRNSGIRRRSQHPTPLRRFGHGAA